MDLPIVPNEVHRLMFFSLMGTDTKVLSTKSSTVALNIIVQFVGTSIVLYDAVSKIEHAPPPK